MADKESDYNKPIITKILVVGDHDVGKTSLIQRYVYKSIDITNNKTTVGMEIESKRVRIKNGKTLDIQLWDIAGQERFIGLFPIYYRSAVGAVVVFDITSKQSLNIALKWKNEIDNKLCNDGNQIPIVLFANKWDLIMDKPELRDVSDDELNEFCHNNGFQGWYSTSAILNTNNKNENETKKDVIKLIPNNNDNNPSRIHCCRSIL